MSFTHLTSTERNELYKLRITDQLSMSEIGRRMNRSKSTISRELSRNTDECRHVDKALKYLLACLAKDKTMEEVNRVTLKLFEPVKQDFRKTMSFDNGREFCGHEKLS